MFVKPAIGARNSGGSTTIESPSRTGGNGRCGDPVTVRSTPGVPEEAIGRGSREPVDMGVRETQVECPTGCGLTPRSETRRSMKTPIASRHSVPVRTPRTCGLRKVAALLAAALTLLGSGLPCLEAAERAPAPSPDARAAYWIERLVRGPEPMTFEIPKVYKDLLLDAEANLEVVADASLVRLSDAGLQQRVQSQDDANPWHAILAVLARIGSRRPEVARAWAGPALRHELLTLRRAAMEVFEALSDRDDTAILLESIERDATDRLVGPRAAAILLKFGAPQDTAAARAVYARAPADGPLMSSGLWAELPSLAAEASGGARPDLLAWWSFLTENAGPRRADPARGGNGKGRALDPELLAVVAVPHALTSGARAAATARLALSGQGGPSARAQAQRDIGSPDPDVREVASALSERAMTDEERAAVRRRAMEFVASLPGPTHPSPEDVASVARALRSDESPEALELLTELFRAIPVNADWKVAVLAVFDGLVVRSVPLGPEIERVIGLGTAEAVDLALYLARRSGGATFIPVFEAFLASPQGAPHRLRLRRELAFLYTGRLQHGGLDAETLGKLAKDVATWVEDESDPSAVGLIAVLADLGALGEARIVEGLRGSKRSLYVDGLSLEERHYLGVEVTAALLEPVTRRTGAPERQRLLGITFHVASGAATPILEDLRARLSDEGRADVDSILGLIRHRASLGR